MNAWVCRCVHVTHCVNLCAGSGCLNESTITSTQWNGGVVTEVGWAGVWGSVSGKCTEREIDQNRSVAF